MLVPASALCLLVSQLHSLTLPQSLSPCTVLLKQPIEELKKPRVRSPFQFQPQHTMSAPESTPLLGDSSAARSPPPTKLLGLRRAAHQAVEGTIDSPLEYLILGLIGVNVVLLAVSTLVVDPKCFGSSCVRLGDKYDGFFETAEAVSVMIFTVEYVLRIWSCVEFPEIAARGALWGRVKYATGFFALVDLLAIAPYWGALVLGAESPDFTTAVRCFRLIRLLKAEKYLASFALLGSVLAENSTLLVASSFYALLMWVLFATALYMTEVDNPAQGTHFQSIPQAMYPVCLMLTGEFPLVDFTPLGQAISGSIAVIAVAIFAVPSAVLASGFIKALQDTTGREFTVDID